MSKPFGFNKKILLNSKYRFKQLQIIAKTSNLLFFAIALVVFAILIGLWDNQTTYYAHAYTGDVAISPATVSPLLEGGEQKLFANKPTVVANNVVASKNVAKIDYKPKAKLFEVKNVKTENKLGLVELATASTSLTDKNNSNQLTEKLYGMVGETPIKDMVPFISKREQRVAAFLVGIAKKESSFGLASPSKDGQTCYNYWGYKGEGKRGTGMGYACFASAEEAIQTVGDRLEVLVNKDRNTPSRMVDTWKCGKSCAGDPGAPSWTSTVAIYFDQIVNQNI
jgi:hypothetical protein